MTGSLSKVENFYLRNDDFKSMLKYGRTEEIKALYQQNPPTEMEKLVGAKFVKLFTDVDLKRMKSFLYSSLTKQSNNYQSKGLV